jgi:hypothetical protein
MISDKNTTKTKKELCILYRISAGTLRDWLKKIDLIQENKNNRILTPKQLLIIYDIYGNPGDIG